MQKHSDMKLILARLPLLGLIGGLILLFLPEASHNPGHNHLLHILLFATPLVILTCILLIQEKILYVSNRFQIATLIILLFFTILHAAPAVEAFKYHHQLQSTTEHPCCVPQIVDSVTSVDVVSIEEPVREEPQARPTLPLQIFTRGVNNRSPPYPLS